MKSSEINVWSYLSEYESQRKDILNIVDRVFSSGRLIFGEELRLFEQEFSKWLDVKCCIGVGNGTDAITIALQSLNIGCGDEVITVSSTAVPTISAIVAAGARPVFCDIDNSSYNIDVSKVSDLINENTKAIIAVHLYGNACKLIELKKICEQKSLYLIEDCAQAHGTLYQGKKVGSVGDVAAFSFYPTKTLGGYGDAGACVTNDDKTAEKMRKIRFYGMEKSYYSEIDGINSRMDEVHAGILRYKLNNLDNDINRRREIARFYREELINTDYIMPEEEQNSYHSYYLFAVRHNKRDEIIKFLKEQKVNINISYPWPVHSMPPYKKYPKSDMQNTDMLASTVFSLPMYPTLTDNEVMKVVKLLKIFHNKRNLN